MGFAQKFDPLEAKRIVEQILKGGYVTVTTHCRQDSMPKRHVDMNDVLCVLEHGQIVREPEWDRDNENWKYRIEGTDVEGEELIAVAAIESTSMLIVITVF